MTWPSWPPGWNTTPEWMNIMTEADETRSGKSETPFEQILANDIARELLQEQRRARRWGIFFKSLLALYLFAFLVVYLSDRWQTEAAGLGMGGKLTAVVDIDGVLSSSSQASADNIIAGLRAAFKNKNTAGVILRINSPGGSPVVAGYVNDEIYRLRKKHPDIPVYAVIQDICASGGYYIAAAADKIYADKASIVGSIGVIMSGFGFVDAINKLGIERRVLHAGKHKDFMDPFAPLNKQEVEHVNTMLNNIYQQFIAVVKKGRGNRLKGDDRIFSGLVWTGAKAKELGLVDGLGSASYVAREVIGVDNMVNFTHRESYFDRFAQRLGTSMADRLYTSIKPELVQ